jgi:hypothetical protein
MAPQRIYTWIAIVSHTETYIIVTVVCVSKEIHLGKKISNRCSRFDSVQADSVEMFNYFVLAFLW